MKAFKLLLMFLSVLVLLSSCQERAKEEKNNTKEYNHELALKLKADQYGMSPYVMAFLKRGPNRSQDSITAANLQKAHLENITKMAEEGTLVLAGPFLDDGNIRGIYIFNVATVEEARKLTESDPAIKAGRLVMELHPWYGSAAIKKINAIHNQLTKESISE